MSPGVGLLLESSYGNPSIVGPITLTLNYEVSVSGGYTFKSAGVSSLNSYGTTEVDKWVSTTEAGPAFLNLQSLNGNPQQVALSAPYQGLTTLYVSEMVTINTGGEITGFGDQFTVTAVPEPSSIIACALMVLPFGASAVRILRRKV
jgi:hypothetical protein